MAGAPAQRADDAAAPRIAAPTIVRNTPLTLLTVIAVAASLHVARDVCVPLVLGLLASYALEPIVAWGTRRGVPRTAAAATVVLVLVGAVAGTAWALADDAAAIASRVPDATRRLRGALRGGPPAPIDDVGRLATEIERGAAQAGGQPAPPPPGVTRVEIVEKPIDVRAALVSGSVGAVGLAGQALLLTFLVFFLLASGDLFKRKLTRLAGPSLSQKRVTVQALDEIARQVQWFLLVNLVTSIAVALASWAAFRWIGLENAGLWGLAAGVFNTIPYVGPLVVTVGVAVAAYLQFGTLGMTLVVVGAAFAVTSLEGFLLTPWLAGRAARMNHVAIFVGLMFWGWLWGIPGVLLAVPMMAVVKVVCDHVEELKPLGELLGD